MLGEVRPATRKSPPLFGITCIHCGAEMTDEFVDSVSDRSIELYEKITGERFVRDEAPDVLARIESNVRNMLARLH